MSLVEAILGESTDPTAAIQQIPIGTDDALTLLRNSRRRAVITLVAADTDSWTLDGLAREIARQENGHESTFDVRGKERKRVYIALYQTHLEKLADADAITRDRDEIRPGPNADALAELLTVIGKRVSQ